MLTLDHPTAGFRDYSISAASARVALAQLTCGPGPERSDPYTEWAIRFDQGLKRVDERIRVWSRDAAAFADEDLEAPSRETIVRAIEVINQLKLLVMDRVAPATATLLNVKGVSLGSGGEISLELGSGPFAVTYRIESDGTVTELFFRNNRLIRRDQIQR
ncbi:MAG: hypothetical protein IT436_08085 [Phycisphaerales bacterium]|nr:hypothetical protein [Phycisphaerales bacterium]